MKEEERNMAWLEHLGFSFSETSWWAFVPSRGIPTSRNSQMVSIPMHTWSESTNHQHHAPYSPQPCQLLPPEAAQPSICLVPDSLQAAPSWWHTTCWSTWGTNASCILTPTLFSGNLICNVTLVFLEFNKYLMIAFSDTYTLGALSLLFFPPPSV